ncbi:MAG TPA: carbamoyltransferase C-terminal domain-containing protein, partial [Methylovirgula sp.]|nr:carbamoyltransferase C-terminal domain-containing protein [Methylovirgula sp.]
MDHAYWGPEYGAVDISSLLATQYGRIADAGCTIEELTDESELCRRAAIAISEGKVLGWFQGRMEWGPRALGNRSILCDPRRADMKAILNAKIKRRESFRPFAPSILESAVDEWFEENDAVPFMMQVFQIREAKRPLIPAVTHVDGSGRLQTVSFETNSRYYRVIQSFAKLTGVPMVLNTSFNENEPVVCRPQEALDCFLRTNMDVLILNNILITRPSAADADTKVFKKEAVCPIL